MGLKKDLCKTAQHYRKYRLASHGMARQIRRLKSTSNIYLRALDVVAGPLTLTDLALFRQRSLTAGHFELDQSKNYKS